jgi:Na+-transporting methylmalonyl-CoA/oxaloacetate decarboxylase beta subunit
MNIVMIFQVVSIGSELSAQEFLRREALRILVLVAIAFGLGTASGVLMGN